MAPTRPAPMGRSLRVLAALLAYPDAAQRAHLTEMQALLQAEPALSGARRRELGVLMARLRSLPPLQAEAEYVALFDQGRRTSLHLFEHVHGDSRERGPALVDLARTYAQAGLLLAEGELPDYLPAVLEFASTQPPAVARGFLAEMAHILNALFAALERQASPYASVLGALLELAGEPARPVTLEPEAPLDEAWAEPEAFGGCASPGQARPATPQPIHLVRPPAAGAAGVRP